MMSYHARDRFGGIGAAIGDTAIGDIRERFGVLQEALGDTVLEEDVMVFRGLLGGQPGDDDMLPTADLLSRERNDELWD